MRAIFKSKVHVARHCAGSGWRNGGYHHYQQTGGKLGRGVQSGAKHEMHSMTHDNGVMKCAK